MADQFLEPEATASSIAAMAPMRTADDMTTPLAATPTPAHDSKAPTTLQGKAGANDRLTRFIEIMDGMVYVLVGMLFLVAALISLIYGVLKFGYSLAGIINGNLSNVTSPNAAAAIISFVSDLLLTLIIMEVLGTVVHYLQTRVTSLKPFLFIGIISATRGVLAVGARLSVTDFSQLHGNEFTGSMIELGVNAGVIIALGLTLRLIGRFLDDEPKPKSAARQPGATPNAE